MINFILCGGSGTRLWPLSRTMLPKQFVQIFNNQSLFQQTVLRNRLVCDDYFVISNVDQYFLAVDQLLETGSPNARFLLEPVGRNTAPAIALACFALASEDLVLVTPSDHCIKDEQAYIEAVQQAAVLAQNGQLVTFGIQPTYPETGFGYIEADGEKVLSFKEKPDAETAKKYLETNSTLNPQHSTPYPQPSTYLWNSGMFCFQAGIFLAELEKYAPDIFRASQLAYDNANISQNEIRIDIDAMLKIPSQSIDYAVMEQSAQVAVVPCDIGWSDLGSFDALYEESKENSSANSILSGQGVTPEPLCVGSKNNLVVTANRQVALVDVEDLLVVDTNDALLIARKGSSQNVKQVVNLLKEQHPELTECHPLVHRPWGTYEVIVASQQYKVKRIVVKPGAKLSLQKHFHRNEHWIVVSGTATVTVGDKTYLVRQNESTYIQMGQVHRLENQGKIDLVMVEVQVGEYTGEDDIVRMDDTYGRQ